MKKAGDLLAAFLDERLMETARGYTDLFSSWKSLAGDKIASHSRIKDLERSILLVEADHPGWVQILQTKQRELLAAVRCRFPDLSIAGISFCLSRRPPAADPGISRAGDSPGNPDRIPKYSIPPAPSPIHDRKPGDHIPSSAGFYSEKDRYEKITDDGLKESFKRLERIISGKTR
jgi:hypothetical protein